MRARRAATPPATPYRTANDEAADAWQFVLDPFGPFWRWWVVSGPGEDRSGWALTRAQAKRAAIRATQPPPPAKDDESP